MSTRYLSTYVALLAALSLWAVPAVAFGNSTPAFTVPGSSGLVVPTVNRDVRIERERLSFDFVSSVVTPTVKAGYDLANTSARNVELDLLFVGPTSGNLRLALDGAQLNADKVDKVQLPAGWLAPKTGIDPRTGQDYAIADYSGDMGRTSAWSLRIQLPASGRGTLTAEYESLTGYDRKRADYVIRHLAYVLGPAGNWAGFGTLEVTATVPSRYLLASNPGLTRQHDTAGVATYSATFQGIPAEMLRISTMASPSAVSEWVGWTGFGLPFVAGLIVAAGLGTWCRRINGRVAAFLVGGTLAFVATVALGAALDWTVMAQEPFSSAMDDRADLANINYAHIFSALVLAPFAASLVAATWAASGRRGGRPGPRGEHM